MKILVTGSNGQLGNEIRSIIDSGRSEIGGDFSAFKDSDVEYVDVEELDITVLNDVLNYIEKGKYDVIINCAAYTNVNACESNIDLAFKVNSLGPRNLAIAADRVNAKLIHVSTDYVFEGIGTEPYREWDLKVPQSVYGKTKALAEDYIQSLCNKYFIVRTSWLYGYIGGNFVKTIMKLAIDKGEVKVVNDQVGNPTNANDLAHHLLKLALTEEYGIYNCTGNGECSWYEFAKKIIEFSGIEARVNPCTTEEFPTPAKRPEFSSLDNLMLRCTIGDEMRNWESALKEYISKVKVDYKN